MNKTRRIALLYCLFLSLYVSAFGGSTTTGAGTNSTEASKSGGTNTAAREKKMQPEEKTTEEKRRDTLMYGLENEVINLIDVFIKERDSSLLPELQSVFFSAKSTALKDKIITCYTEFSYDILKDHALAVLEDPYDEKKSVVIALIKYTEKLHIGEAAPMLRKIIKSENSDFFESAVNALGTVGTDEDAAFFAELFKSDLTLPQKQTVVKALGKLKADQSWDALVEMAENEDENAFVRMYAAEAIGNIRPKEAESILAELFENADPNLRQYIVKGFAENTSETARSVLLSALKDNHYKVRLEAVGAVQGQKLKEAVPSLLYRAKNDSETAVQYACFEALASLNDSAGIDYMISVLEDMQKGDTLKAKIAVSLLKYGNAEAAEAVIKLALQTVSDDKKKNLRYALGKEFGKYENAKFESVCEAYIKSTDIATKAVGLDIYKKNPYPSVTPLVQSIADEDKASTLRTKAKSLLKKD